MSSGRIARLVFLALAIAGVAVPAQVEAAARALARPQAQTEAQTLTLADAAEVRDGALIRDLLQEGADVDARQIDGMTALHWAVFHDDDDVAGLLVRSGGDGPECDLGRRSRGGLCVLPHAAGDEYS